MDTVNLELLDEHRANLKTLANYLMKFENDRMMTKFTMRTFAEIGGDEFPLEWAEELPCGAVGCAVGHGPSAGIASVYPEDWVDYAERVFYAHPSEREAYMLDDPAFLMNCIWNWCFDCDWTSIDNSAVGAAKRINHMLEQGVVPISTSVPFEEFKAWYKETINPQVS